jgi:hypothetical protein
VGLCWEVENKVKSSHLRVHLFRVTALVSLGFTDEAYFTEDGVFNFHNAHMWDDEIRTH